MPKKKGARENRLPSKGRDLSREEKVSLAAEVCELYKTDQYNLLDCLREVGIRSDATWYKWVAEIEEIEELFIKAQNEKGERYRHHLVQRARTGLERYLEGWTIETVEQEAIPGKDEGQVLITKVKRKQIYIKPSVRAIEFVLINLDGKTFTRNPEPYKAGNERIPEKIKIEIINDSKPITSEDDITDIDTDSYVKNYRPL